jgi:hypothetical protein
MQWLTAVLAFATTMLILTVVVSTFTELIHRLFNLRTRGFYLMLTRLFENVIEPRIYGHTELSKELNGAVIGLINKVPQSTAGTTAKDAASEADKFVNEEAQRAVDAAAATKRVALEARLGVAPPTPPDTAETLEQKSMLAEAKASALRALADASAKVLADAQTAADAAAGRAAILDAVTQAASAYPPHSGKATVRSEQFCNAIMQNRARASDAGKAGLLSWFPWPIGVSRIDDMDVEVFSQKLADRSILGDVELTADEIKDIGQKFVAYGAEATEYFRGRARVISTVLAIPVAVSFYVHPYNLAVAYMRDAELANKVADLHTKATEAYEAMEKKLTDTKLVTTEQGAGGAAVVPGDGEATPADAKQQAQQMLEEVRDVVDKAKAETKKLADLGVPIGWPDDKVVMRGCKEDIAAQPEKKLGEDEAAALKAKLETAKLYPAFCRWDASPDKSEVLSYITPDFWPGWSNVGWLLIGGLLIGLGSPFWAQAVSALTSSRDAVNKITEIVTGKPPTGKQGAAMAALPLQPSADAVVESHKLARK